MQLISNYINNYYILNRRRFKNKPVGILQQLRSYTSRARSRNTYSDHYYRLEARLPISYSPNHIQTKDWDFDVFGRSITTKTTTWIIQSAILKFLKNSIWDIIVFHCLPRVKIHHFSQINMYCSTSSKGNMYCNIIRLHNKKKLKFLALKEDG